MLLCFIPSKAALLLWRGVKNLKNTLYAYLRRNALLLFVLFCMFIAGVIFGSMGVVFLDPAQKKEIAFFVDRVFQDNVAYPSMNTLLKSAIVNVKLIAVIWFLGLTIIGIPLVAVVVFTRGFALGFTITFLIKLKGTSGIAAVILTLLPPNFFYVPLLIFAAASSIVFSLCLIKSYHSEVSLSKNFLAYTLFMITIAFAGGCIGVLQSLLSPFAVKAVFLTLGGGRNIR